MMSLCTKCFANQSHSARLCYKCGTATGTELRQAASILPQHNPHPPATETYRSANEKHSTEQDEKRWQQQYESQTQHSTLTLSCKYGSACYRTNPEHIRTAHQGKKPLVQPPLSTFSYFNASKQASRGSDSIRSSKLRDFRIQIGQETREIVGNGGYLSPISGMWNRVSSTPELSSRHTYTEHELRGDGQNPLPSCPFVVEVVNDDCLRVAKKLGDCCVLNMACASKPGGGFLGGAGAQEENLCRRSNYYQSLQQVQYPLPQWGAVFTPRVQIFRDTEAQSYALLDRSFTVNMLAVAADHRKLSFDTNPLRLTREERKQMVYTVRSLLLAASQQRQHVLVLGALGCGAFNNPPADVASVFREVLSERRFSKAFSRVVFAILDDHNTGRAHNPDGNLLPFQREFGGPQTPHELPRPHHETACASSATPPQPKPSHETLFGYRGLSAPRLHQETAHASSPQVHRCLHNSSLTMRLLDTGFSVRTMDGTNQLYAGNHSLRMSDSKDDAVAQNLSELATGTHSNTLTGWLSHLTSRF
jgi:uncharacterized protein (TIGR02452 family)